LELRIITIWFAGRVAKARAWYSKVLRAKAIIEDIKKGIETAPFQLSVVRRATQPSIGDSGGGILKAAGQVKWKGIIKMKAFVVVKRNLSGRNATLFGGVVLRRAYLLQGQ